MNKVNNNNFSNLEILSPAGSEECFYADINAGADAIYLGLSSFNARMKAQNFTTENIKSYVDYAHLMGVKIYITLNTLVTDDDFDDVIKLVQILTDAKVDAFIIQDVGIAYILKQTFKNIVIHASTQLGIHNLEGAIIAEKMGFSRIVLSREAKLEDIKQIKENTNLEIEYFVQGALCVAFSGNCYFSSLEKGKSGNEGKCLQLCRLPYKNNLTNETEYNLSARDLSLLESMKDLVDAGVCSFKIEGRMRHAGYCAIVTHTYKTAINKIIAGEFSKEWALSQNKFLMETFSRGDFNKRAYLDKGTPDNIIFKDYQNHIGTKIGKVTSVKPFKDGLFKVQIQTQTELHSGDGIKIIDTKNKKQIASLGIGGIQKIKNDIFEFVTKYNFKSGLSVFLTQNFEYENKILSEKKLLPFSIHLIAFSGQKLKAIVNYNDLKFSYESDFILEKAKNIPLDENAFLSQLGKLSDTNFTLKKLSLETDGVFIPKSLLNDFRRNIICTLKTKIIENCPAPSTKFDNKKLQNILKIDVKTVLKPQKIAIIDENCEITDNLLSEFDTIVFSPKNYNLDIVLKFKNLLGEKFALNLPTIENAYDLEILNRIIDNLAPQTKLYANNIYGLYYSQKYEVIASPLLNIKNMFAVKNLLNFGVKTICSSIEATDDFPKSNNLISFYQGKFPLMTFAHCPYKTIFGNSCTNCTYKPNLEYSNEGLNTYNINKKKIFNCYFELTKNLNKNKTTFFIVNFIK